MQSFAENKSIESPISGGVKRLLVCLDGSKCAEVGLEYATSVAKALCTEITLLHIHESVSSGKHPTPVDTLGTAISKANSRKYLETVKEKLAKSGTKCDSITAQGEVAEQIIRAGMAELGTMLVMSSHGENGEMKWRLGSTTQKVVSRLSSSVLVVRPESLDTPEKKKIKRVLLPLDASVRAECALPLAVGLAKAHDAELMLVHLALRPQMSIPMPTNRDDQELSRKLLDRNLYLADTYLRGIEQNQAAHQKLSITRHVAETTDVGQGIIDLAEKEQADLIILSAHGRTGNMSLPHGYLPHYLLSYCSKPILVLQDLARSTENGTPTEDTPNRIPHARLI